MNNTFKPGDVVVCICKDHPRLVCGEEYVVEDIKIINYVSYLYLSHTVEGFYLHRFKLAKTTTIEDWV